MKKVISLILSVVMLLSITAGLDMSVYATQTSDYRYEIYSGNRTAVIIEYRGSGGDVTIPSKYTSGGIKYNVIGIGQGAFRECTKLTGVTIPDGVTSIDESAFFECTNLTYAEIGKDISNIGAYAFSGCTNLTDVKIFDNATPSDGLKYIHKYAFARCTNLKNITIPSSVMMIYDGTFLACSNLEFIHYSGTKNQWFEVDIGAGNDVLKSCIVFCKDCFYKPNGYSFIENVIIDNITYRLYSNYEARVMGCNGCDIEIPEMITFANYQFSITRMDHISFKGNKDIRSVILPKCITRIDDGMFEDCTNLTSVTIPDSVTSIGGKAFYNCSRLSSLTIPSSVKKIEDFAFTNCSNLSSLIIPDSVACIGTYAFKNCTGLTNATIGNGLTIIDEHMFENCRSLTRITVPNNINIINDYAFYDCTSLQYVFVENPKCKIYDSLYTFPYGVVICGSENSTANKFANEHRFSVSFIPHPPHLWDNGKVTIETSRSQDGVKTYTCLLCGEIKTEQLHNWNFGKVTTVPTCTSIGVKTYTCTVCGKNRNEEMPMISHKPIKDDAVVADCTKTGLTEGSHCSVCGKILQKQEAVPKTNHIYDNGKVTTDATCNETGIKIYTCSICGGTYDEVIPKTAHSYDNGKVTKKATCKATGVKTYTCQTCGAAKTETIAKAGHTYKNVVTKATLSKNGKIDNKCSVCGKVSKTTIVYYPKTIKLSKSTFVYNGKAQKPSIIVKDSKGNTLKLNKDYTVSYSNASSKNVGKYTVTIKLKGNYSGTKTIGYLINPKGTEFLPSNKGGFKAISKGFTLKWNKQASQTTGYQIQYATKSDFSNAATITIANPNTTSYTIKGRAANTRYYVRVRTYKKIGTGTFYSSWNSGTKSVVTLK